jgi:hypothetical protein
MPACAEAGWLRGHGRRAEQDIPGLDYPDRDRRIAAGPPLLGLEAAGSVAEGVCAAGTAIIWQDQLFHRKSRQRSAAARDGEWSRNRIWGGLH